MRTHVIYKQLILNIYLFNRTISLPSKDSLLVYLIKHEHV